MAFLRTVPLALCVALCIALPVEQPTSQDEQVVTKEVLYQEGQQLTIPCLARQDAPVTEYTWLKNNQPIKIGGDVQQSPDGLKVSKPTLDTEGTYTCLAKSALGISTSVPIAVKRAYFVVPIPDKTEILRPVEGEPLMLYCIPPHDAYPKPSVEWIYPQVRDKRIVQGPDSNLYFSNITKEDTGNKEYICVANNSAHVNPVVLAKYILEDVVPNKEKQTALTPVYLNEDMVVRVGNVTSIYCIFGGTPLAHPDWYHNGKLINNKPSDRVTDHNRTAGRRLLIRDTYLSDQGNYTCKVDNGLGTFQHSITLTVLSEPTYAEKPTAKITAPEGSDVVIPCVVKGVSAPKISWSHNANPIKVNDRITIDSTGYGKDINDVVVGKLVIKKVTKADAGYYGCKAENENGAIFAESLLVV